MVENIVSYWRWWLTELRQIDWRFIVDLPAVVAARIETAAVTLVSDGGPVTHWLLILTALAVLITLVKFLQLTWLRVGPQRRARQALRLWHRGPRQKALKQLARQRGPVGQTLAAAMHGLLAHPQLVDARVREQAQSLARTRLAQLRSHLVLLKLLAIVGPLLGLLGTLLALIEALRQVDQAAPAVLSAGALWRALLPSAAGLGLSIFATVAYCWLSRRLSRCEAFIDEMLGRVFSREPASGEATPPAAVPPISAQGDDTIKRKPRHQRR